jgi:hypothetical protein
MYLTVGVNETLPGRSLRVMGGHCFGCMTAVPAFATALALLSVCRRFAHITNPVMVAFTVVVILVSKSSRFRIVSEGNTRTDD